VTLSHIDSQVI